MPPWKATGGSACWIRRMPPKQPSLREQPLDAFLLDHLNRGYSLVLKSS